MCIPAPSALTYSIYYCIFHHYSLRECSNDYDGCFGSLGPTGDCSSDYGMQASRLGLEFLSEGFSHELSYTRTSTERQDFTASVPTFGSQGEQVRGEYIGSATTLDGVDLIWGFDYQKDVANSMGRKNQGVFVELLSDFSQAFFFTAGLRYDDNEDFGANTSFRLSTAFLLETKAGTLKFKAALGSGFRAPSPFEIQYNRGPYAFPPATSSPLVQEESRGWEVGAQLDAEKYHLEAIIFDQSVSNAIVFDLVGYSGYLQDLGRGVSSESCTICKIKSASLSEIGAGLSALPPINPITLGVSLIKCQVSSSNSILTKT